MGPTPKSRWLPAREACESLGLKPRSDVWLRENGVPIRGKVKNKKGRPSSVIAVGDLIFATRKNQVGWTAWKKFDFECRVRGIHNPIEVLYLIVLACAPDPERLRAVMHLCQDPQSQMLERLVRDDFCENTSYRHHGLECWLGNDLRERMKGVVSLWERLCSKPEASVGDAWRQMKEWVAEWPQDAAKNGADIYSGALLLCEPLVKKKSPKKVVEAQSLLFRCPAYIQEFRTDLQLRANSMPVGRIPKFLKGQNVRLHTTTATAFPSELLDDLSRLPIPLSLIAVPSVEPHLHSAGAIDFGGRSGPAYILAKEELTVVADALREHAKTSGVDLPWNALKSALKAWNYRTNVEREKYLRAATTGSSERGSRKELSDEDAEEWTSAPPALKRLTAAELSRVFAE